MKVYVQQQSKQIKNIDGFMRVGTTFLEASRYLSDNPADADVKSAWYELVDKELVLTSGGCAFYSVKSGEVRASDSVLIGGILTRASSCSSLVIPTISPEVTVWRRCYL